MYKKYTEDIQIPVPVRTAFRHAAVHKSAFSTSGRVESDMTGQNKNSAGDVSSESNYQPGLVSVKDSSDSDDNDVKQTTSNSHVTQTEASGDSPVHCCEFSRNVESTLDPSDNSLTEQSSGSSFDSSSENDSSKMTDSEESDQSSGSFTESMFTSGTDISQNETQILCVLSYILRYNLSGTASKDILKLLPLLYPGTSNLQNITYEQLSSVISDTSYKTVHYCNICSARFPEDPDKFSCSTNGCTGYRYKGPLSSQMKKYRQPNSCFVIADIRKQLQYLFQRKNTWKSVQETKQRVTGSDRVPVMTDIVDSKYYRTLCGKGEFLHSSDNISAVFNTDGIPLYSSSNVKLWPVFLAINELPPAVRFARENMILAAVWQGKSKPPFSQYMCSFGEEMCKLYSEGFPVSIPGNSTVFTVRLGVFLATMDLQAKGYVLSMTMHNGKYGCSTCEEPGETEKQGKGFARHYPYRPPHARAEIRNSDDVKYEKGPNSTSSQRVKGITGMSGLAVMPWFDVVLGIVPDYMHGVLLGVTKTLMHKFFSPTNIGKPYFVGKYLKKISKRLQGMCPPDYIERMPRDLEKNYNHFKASELQSWLLFYALPCLKGYLREDYLEHLSLLSEGIHLLLGDAITENELIKAENLLDSFYAQFANLYGKGSCGLNVHNIGAHLTFYARMWGPLWTWSCFGFEDWNAALLQSVHGTGDVTRQCLQMKEIQLKLSSIDVDSIPNDATRSFLKRMTKTGKMWKSVQSVNNVKVAGSLLKMHDLPCEIITATGTDNIKTLRKCARVRLNNEKLYSKLYTRMKKRICYVVRCKNGDIREILYFIINPLLNSVYALAHKIQVHSDSFICDIGPQHIIRVMKTTDQVIFPVENIIEKVFFMDVDDKSYIACVPNRIGHGVFK